MDKKEEIPSLKIEPAQFLNPSELKDYLISLYLGPCSEYRLDFPEKYQEQMDALFDEIISEHGVTSVFFFYNRKSSKLLKG